ncbi:MAG: chromosome segregation protein SMC [Gammaproteobacteria bacterium RIFCSPHIGHO2_12_FULL_45_9]|nr:MAG: chromosome segregation protein SMC [Gammaproteobacteria bacterium RIFCSPHIGHO2_12_FULL_45_9]
MQLKKIKLAGFKSFVDPTTVVLPSNLISIVGPNGCGKSNIIDAVCWVMGENSPKYLRGESLADVIFNGSATRKPVGQSSVELIFDNQDSSIGGEYAKYTEISIKRVLTRDTDSNYYLNGTRCRRKDIIDIFLGTGLGPRSYSIIGQNMISRIIEAKPDEMRVYLDEAAGISRYKERRRETENRIQHTKENLSRVNDVRFELEKQLGHLQRQANTAERFKALKQQERLLRGQWYAVQYRQLGERMGEYALQLQQQETALEAGQAELTGVDKELEQIHQDQRTANEAFQEVQRRFYAAGNDITRIEQDLLHQQEKQHQWEADCKQIEQDLTVIQEQLGTAEDEISELEAEIQNVEPELTAAAQMEQGVKEALFQAEEAVVAAQTHWDSFYQLTAKTEQTAQVEKTQIQHLDQKVVTLIRQQEKLQQDKSQLDFGLLEQEVAALNEQAEQLSDLKQDHDEQCNQNKKELVALQAAQRESTARLDQVRSELQALRGQQASLEALQQNAQGQHSKPVQSWLAQHHLDKKQRLMQNIEVEAGWEYAVEKALGAYLQGICVDQLAEVAAPLKALSEGNLVFLAEATDNSASQYNKSTLLLQKVQSTWPVETLLAGIYVADSLEEALALSPTLNAKESVITRDGTWLSQSWLKTFQEKDPASGVFKRGQELKQILQRITNLESTRRELDQYITQCQEQISDLEEQRDELEQGSRHYHAQLAEMLAKKKMQQERLIEIQSRADSYTKEQEECAKQLVEAQTALALSREQWQQALSQLEQQAKQRDTFVTEREKTRQALQQVREKANQARENKHRFEISLHTAKSEKVSLQQGMMRMQMQRATLTERQVALEAEQASAVPLESLQESLSRSLDKHVKIEAELTIARTSIESLEQMVRDLEAKRHGAERHINSLRSSLEAVRLEWQSVKVKSETLLEQLNELDFILNDILKELPPEATTEGWQANLLQTEQRIQRLGPINLVAIDEYATCSERKEYLDKQCEDLQGGLTILEEAIAKIDKETRARLRETYDKVNQHFQTLFPTVFGGGKAYLELTSDDLLEAGVTVMACPPGKRNSTIHLLSGGEKTMTAIALVFSIFQLNPAPFCLLDEADAALDDTNVVRFCKLIKSMSEKTQFIFISHNKVAIEMADHLLGVTMNEPGVSRLVSVDIQEAIDLAGV